MAFVVLDVMNGGTAKPPKSERLVEVSVDVPAMAPASKAVQDCTWARTVPEQERNARPEIGTRIVVYGQVIDIFQFDGAFLEAIRDRFRRKTGPMFDTGE